MRIKLFIKERSGGGVFETSSDHCVVGRGECDIQLACVTASRQHALIYAGRDGRLRLKDLGSTNGTFLAGRAVSDVALRVGDEIRIGDARVVIVDYQLAAPAPAREPRAGN